MINMKSTNGKAALFDFDGVVMNTEDQYTIFWNAQGKKYLDQDEFGRNVKGQTLLQIYTNHFAGMDDVQQQITKNLSAYESRMAYDYVSGVENFLTNLKKNGVKIALVTSSNNEKMAIVYRVHPELKAYFDRILTADDFIRSKPDPECFLLGMKVFETTPENTVVFEDSFHGLQAGMSSGAKVVGLTTTNPREAIEGKAHFIINSFEGIDFERFFAR